MPQCNTERTRCTNLEKDRWMDYMVTMHGKLSIELNKYSGRENPQWFATDGDVTKIRDMISRALRRPAMPRKATRDWLTLPRLGYRGFVITNPMRLSGIPFNPVRVSEGYVITTERGVPPDGQSVDCEETRFYHDVGLEAYLHAMHNREQSTVKR